MRLGTRANTTHNAFIICSFGAMLVAILFVLCIGCASKEEKEARHLERARQYVEKTEFKKAVIEFRNVVQLDPENDAAHYELGETYLKLQQGREAFQSFSRAVSVNPENMKAQLKMGQILLLGKRTEEAKKRPSWFWRNPRTALRPWPFFRAFRSMRKTLTRP
jgi:Tfp pilus assembly protein PilF